MVASRALQRFSFDAVLGSAVTLACGLQLTQAYLEGQAPLKGQQNAIDCQHVAPKRLELSPKLCRQLEVDGFLVMDNFLNKQEIANALVSIAAGSHNFSKSRQEPDDDDVVRKDHHFFFQSGANEPNQEGLQHVQGLLDRLAFDIVSSSFQGWTEDYANKKEWWLGVPRYMQVSVFDCSLPGQPDHFDAHRDAVKDPISEIGLMGYFRASYTRRRYLTCVLYLNPDWQKGDGGTLRIRQKDGTHTDIEPRGGRLVMFSSEEMQHGVQPTYAKRFACSVWLTLNPN
jgi:hypothetical protein